MMRKLKRIDEKKRLIIAILLILACIWANWSVNNKKEAEQDAKLSQEAIAAVDADEFAFGIIE